MDPKTALRYLDAGKLPSEMKQERDWRTREDPFTEVWEELAQQLEDAPRLDCGSSHLGITVFRRYRCERLSVRQASRRSHSYYVVPISVRDHCKGCFVRNKSSRFFSDGSDRMELG